MSTRADRLKAFVTKTRAQRHAIGHDALSYVTNREDAQTFLITLEPAYNTYVGEGYTKKDSAEAAHFFEELGVQLREAQALLVRSVLLCS